MTLDLVSGVFLMQDSVEPAVAVAKAIEPSFPWLELALVLVAGAAAAISFWAIISARWVAQRQSTLQMLMDSEADADMIGAKKLFIHLANRNGGLGQFGEKDKLDSEESMAIRMVLNELELIALGIERGILDYDFVAGWSKTTIIQYYEHALPFITVVRRHSQVDTYYSGVETLYGWLTDKQTRPRKRIRSVLL